MKETFRLNIIPLPVQINTLSIKRPNLEIDYPVITGLSNKEIENKVNNEIIKNVNNLIFQQGYIQEPKIDIKGSYEIKTNERNILSLTLLSYSYSGGVHGFTIIKGLTFDIITGEVISFSQLFKKNRPYKEEVSEIIKKEILERKMPILGGFNEILPEQDYYIADKSLVIFFQLYQLSPYAQGFPAFPISLYRIKDLIGDKSILKRMMTFY